MKRGTPVGRLIALARRARRLAYAPYSGLHVGAALLAEDGKVYLGCNVENASYSQSMCAERSAIFHAVSRGVKKFRAMAVATDAKFPIMPCGACRQVMSEFHHGMTLISGAASGPARVVTTIKDLLPSAFRSQDLKRSKRR